MIHSIKKIQNDEARDLDKSINYDPQNDNDHLQSYDHHHDHQHDHMHSKEKLDVVENEIVHEVVEILDEERKLSRKFSGIADILERKMEAGFLIFPESVHI